MANRPRHSTIHYSPEIDLEARAFIKTVSRKDQDRPKGHFEMNASYSGVSISKASGCFSVASLRPVGFSQNKGGSL